MSSPGDQSEIVDNKSLLGAPCSTVLHLGVSMPTTKQRISINLPEDEYAELSAMAEKHRISMAWIGRKAILDFVERYREGPLQLPLTFVERGEQS